MRRTRSAKGARHYSGLFWSGTNLDHVLYESRLELDRLLMADFDPGVSRIAAQPMWLSGKDGSENRRHVPDLLLLSPDGSVTVVDVKPARFAADPKVAAVFGWAGRVCAARGWRFEVWSGGDPVRLANLRVLARGRRPMAELDQVMSHLEDTVGDGSTWAEMVAGGTGSGYPRPMLEAAVVALLWRGRWWADLSVPLSRESFLCSAVTG